MVIDECERLKSENKLLLKRVNELEEIIEKLVLDWNKVAYHYKCLVDAKTNEHNSEIAGKQALNEIGRLIK